MILTLDELQYASESIKLYSDTPLSIPAISEGNFTLLRFDTGSYTTIENFTVVTSSDYIEITTKLEGDKFYYLTAFSIPASGSSELVIKQTFRFLYIDDTLISNGNNVYNQIKSIDNILSCEHILKNENDYVIKFNPAYYNNEIDNYENLTEEVTINNQDIILDKLIALYFNEYKTFYDVINSQSSDVLQNLDKEYIENLHLTFMNNIVKFYSLKGNKAYIELMFSLYAKYLNKNVLSIVEDPNHNFMYRISSSLSKSDWETQIKPYVHPLSWNAIYSEITSDTNPIYYQLIDIRRLMKETWNMSCVSYFDAQEYSDHPYAHYKKINYIYHSSGNIEPYNYKKIAHVTNLDYNVVYQDEFTAINYILIFQDGFLKIEPTALPYSQNAKIIRDIFNHITYSIIINDGKLLFEEVPSDIDYSVSHYVKDYDTGLIYKMYIENGLLKVFDNSVTYDNTITPPAVSSFYIEPSPWNLISVDSIFQDENTGTKYILLSKFNNPTLVPVTSDRIIKDTTPTDYNYKIINDQYDGKSYELKVIDGVLIPSEVPYNSTYKSIFYIKDYTDNITFSLKLEYGIVKSYENYFYQHIHSLCSFKNEEDHSKFNLNLSGVNSPIDYAKEGLYDELKDLRNIKFSIDRFNRSIVVDFRLTGVANTYIYERYNNNVLIDVIVSYGSKAIMPFNDGDIILLKLKKNNWEQYVYKIDQYTFIQNKTFFFSIASNELRNKYLDIRNENRSAFVYNNQMLSNFNSQASCTSLAYSNDFDFLFNEPTSASVFTTEFDQENLFSYTSIDVEYNTYSFKQVSITYAKTGFYKYKWDLYVSGVLVESKEAKVNSATFNIASNDWINNNPNIKLTLYFKNGDHSLSTTINCV